MDQSIVQSEEDLRRLLERYRAQVEGMDAGREDVSVSLIRVAGFQNAVTTGSGHRLLVDEPASFGGGGAAPDPAELLLGAIGASLSVTLTTHAALRQIELVAVKMTLTAWMAAETFFDPGSEAGSGIQELAIGITITTSAAAELITELVAIALAASPVVRSLEREPRTDIAVRCA